MKKMLQIALLAISLIGVAMANTQGNNSLPHTKLAANCPKDCSSCWDQCSTASDCGSGHKCVSSACGNRCVAN